VRQLLEIAFGHLGMDYRDYVETDPAFLRPAEVHHLLGDSSKARQELGWKPQITFQGLVKMMVDEDLARLKREAANSSGGLARQ
jgi:GDPmannose 4,6-dehydratase